MATTRKAALVTGAASGIGRAAALTLARAGYDVAINYQRSEAAAHQVADEAAKLGANAMLTRCDVADDRGVRAMVAAVGERFGALDVLINNAGITSQADPHDFEAMTVEEWDRIFAVNVRGVFIVTRAALPLLRKASAPCIVNTASIVGLRPGPQALPYAASKAAVVNLTRTMALQLGPQIRVNAVAPGWVEGEWMKRMLKDRYQGLIERRAKMTPLGRCVTPDDVADTMLSLITANRFVTGEVIVVDGGYSSTT
jgi:3-oxoacyl-[acyl-carrier protein] reductase